MDRMHASLSVRTNALLICLYSTVLVASVLVSSKFPLYPLIPFVACGFVAGVLQNRAISASPTVFRTAETWLAVRGLLMCSLPGRLSIWLLWANGVGTLCFIAFGGAVASVTTVFGSYASFGLARELATFQSVRTLNARPNVGGENGA
jgi:hypothetical protein